MKNFKFILYTIPIITILLFVAILSYTFIEPKAYDFMVKNVLTEKLSFDTHKNIYGHDDVVLVVIDGDSLEKYRWPWKRDLNCKIFDYFLKYAQPKLFVHDAIISSLDSDSPESDKKFFNTLKKYDNLVEGFMFSIKEFEDIKKGEEYNNNFTKKFGVKKIELNTDMKQIYRSVITSPNIFLDSVKYMGSITIIPGFLNGNIVDDTYRTNSYFSKYNNQILPSLAMSGFMVINNQPQVVINKKYIEFPELNYKISHRISPYINTSIVPIKYYKRYEGTFYSHKSYSAVDIMDSFDNLEKGRAPKISPEIFKDKVVILGVNDPLKDGLNDNKSSPIAINHPALDIQATSIDNLIHRDFMIVLPDWFNVLVTLLAMIFVFYTIHTYKLLKAISCSLLTILFIFGFAIVCFYNCIVINVITPIVMCVMTIVIAYIYKYLTEAKTKEKVESAMGKYMSEDVMKNVIKNIDNLGLGGKKSTVTVLFSDIRGFTSMSETMSAQEVSQLLNEYFSEMEPIVSKYNGIINKFIGDAVMAVFGEPIQDENHPANAVKCALEMLCKVQELDKNWEKEGKPTIQIGIGINTGEVFVGNIGSEKRMEYTVIGDTVNLASRLESYNKTYKTKILISSSTFELTNNEFETNVIKDVEIRGKANKMDIYEVLRAK